MTPDQRAYYWGRKGLWAEACRAQGWDFHDDTQRKKITLEAARQINPTSTCDSITGLNQDQITALFALLKAYADPLDLAKQRRAANPQETHDLDLRQRLIYEIEVWGNHDNYVNAIACWYRRQHLVPHWKELPLDKLRNVLITVTKNARKKGMHPRPKPAPGPSLKEYEMRPRKKFQPRENVPH